MRRAAGCLSPAHSTDRALEVERRGPSPERVLRVEVRYEPLPVAQEERLALVAASQRLAEVRRRADVLRRWHEHAFTRRVGTLC